MSELTRYFAGYLMTFTSGEGDPLEERATLAEVTDSDERDVELAFDLEKPRRRVYLRMKRADLAAILAEPQP